MTKEPESTSGSGYQWVSSLLKASREDNPLVAGEVFARLEILLEGQLSERDLTSTNLKAVATQLIGDTVPKPPEPEETQ